MFDDVDLKKNIYSDRCLKVISCSLALSINYFS